MKTTITCLLVVALQVEAHCGGPCSFNVSKEFGLFDYEETTNCANGNSARHYMHHRRDQTVARLEWRHNAKHEAVSMVIVRFPDGTSDTVGKGIGEYNVKDHTGHLALGPKDTLVGDAYLYSAVYFKGMQGYVRRGDTGDVEYFQIGSGRSDCGRHINVDGKQIVGIYGTEGDKVDDFGLLLRDPPAPPPPPRPCKDVQVFGFWNRVALKGPESQDIRVTVGLENADGTAGTTETKNELTDAHVQSYQFGADMPKWMGGAHWQFDQSWTHTTSESHMVSQSWSHMRTVSFSKECTRTYHGKDRGVLYKWTWAYQCAHDGTTLPGGQAKGDCPGDMALVPYECPGIEGQCRPQYAPFDCLDEACQTAGPGATNLVTGWAKHGQNTVCDGCPVVTRADGKHSVIGVDERQCHEECRKDAHCNAVNYKAELGNCVFRQCGEPSDVALGHLDGWECQTFAGAMPSGNTTSIVLV